MDSEKAKEGRAAVKVEWDGSQGCRRHSAAFKDRVALEAIKVEEVCYRTRILHSGPGGKTEGGWILAWWLKRTFSSVRSSRREGGAE